MKFMTTKVFTAHVPIDLAEKVEQMADRLDRSRGWIIKQALTMWIDAEEKRYILTLEAMKDVDNDQVIDHARVQVWADSLSAKKPLPIPRKTRK